MAGLRISRSKKITFDIKVTIEISCLMDFSDYPFDDHTCNFQVIIIIILHAGQQMLIWDDVIPHSNLVSQSSWTKIFLSISILRQFWHVDFLGFSAALELCQEIWWGIFSLFLFTHSLSFESESILYVLVFKVFSFRKNYIWLDD